MSTFNITTITAESPLSISAAMALPDADKLALLEAILGGALAVRGDNVTVPTVRESSPRGQSPRIVESQLRLRAAFLEQAATSEGATTENLMELAHSLPKVEGKKTWEYHYIAPVAEILKAEGLVVEFRKGRQAIWKLA